jgi:GTP pyrophosphokinase
MTAPLQAVAEQDAAHPETSAGLCEDKLEELLERIRLYNPDGDLDIVRRSFYFARERHEGQTRRTGDPYFTHPLATAFILADVQMDPACIAAGLLHDVVEDSETTLDEIRERFGDEVATMVDGVTKLKLADFETRSQEGDSPSRKRRAEMRRNAENLRKIFLAVARDLRVMMIKLADRLHNMSTLHGLERERQLKVAEETMQIYAPLAHRLGVWKIKWQLEDLAFKYREPEMYQKLVELIDRRRADREADIKKAIEMISRRLERAGIDAEIHGRPKHLWSIYQKMLKENLPFEEIYDLIAVRIIVNTVPECYHALGIVHDLWIPIPERFDDYIARAKPNMYQSLHTKVIGPHGEPLEIQIRTWEMHRTAEFGIAAHWQYKEGTSGSNGFDRKLSWLRQQLFDWQADSKDATEFLRSVINDLFTDQVFVFTPKGDVIDLPAGSTPVDFAYRIHSDLGHHCVAAKVNGRIVPLSYKLTNGAVVDIVTRSNSSPSLDWLNFVKTGHARSKIKAHFRNLQFAESVQRGREMLEKECERQGLDRSVLKSENLTKVLQAFNKQTEDDLLAAIGFGHLGAQAVLHRLAPPEQPQPVLPESRRRIREGRVELEGAEQMMVARAKCCLPLPGDEVIGFVTRGKGLVLHRQTCPNVTGYRASEPERLVEVDWGGEPGGTYVADISIETLDRMGLLSDISAIFSEARINIRSANIRALPNKMASFHLQVEVESLSQLNQVMANVAKLNDVLRIHRLGGKPARTRRTK